MKRIAHYKYTLTGTLFIAVSVVLLFWFLLRGQTFVSGKYPEPEASKSLTCFREDYDYPVYNSQDATKSTTSIVAIFSENSISSISLTQKYYYNDEASAMANKGRFQVTMSKCFAGSSLKYGALGVSYAVANDMLRISLSADSNEINGNSKSYFLINGSPESFSDYKENYEGQQFVCKENTNDRQEDQ